jgi:hypothetical protein
VGTANRPLRGHDRKEDAERPILRPHAERRGEQKHVEEVERSRDED